MNNSATLPYAGLTTVVTLIATVIIISLLFVFLKKYGADQSITNPRFIIMLLITVGFLGVTAYYATHVVPQDEPTGQLLGALIAAFTIVVTYYFGPHKNND